MLAIFAAEGKTPRIEFAAQRFADLPERLGAAGVSNEFTAQLMATSEAPDVIAPREQGQVRLDLDAAAINYCLSSAFYSMARPMEAQLLALDIGQGTLRSAAFEADGDIRGLALLHRTRQTAELVGVWTDPSWRRQGIGRSLCSHVANAFLSEMPGRTVFAAAEGAAARLLYRRLGMSEYGELHGYRGRRRRPISP